MIYMINISETDLSLRGGRQPDEAIFSHVLEDCFAALAMTGFAALAMTGFAALAMTGNGEPTMDIKRGIQ